MKSRMVEYYRLWAGNARDSGTRDTNFIEVPADTPEDKLEEAVREAAAKIKWRDEPPVIVGLYSEGDCEEEEEVEEEPTDAGSQTI